jgi:hypothetical protein
VTLAYVKACRGDEALWHRRWVETSRSITHQKVPALSEVTAEDQGRRTRPAPSDGISTVGRGVFKHAVSVMVFAVLMLAWSAVRSYRRAAATARTAAAEQIVEPKAAEHAG